MRCFRASHVCRLTGSQADSWVMLWWFGLWPLKSGNKWVGTEKLWARLPLELDVTGNRKKTKSLTATYTTGVGKINNTHTRMFYNVVLQWRRIQPTKKILIVFLLFRNTYMFTSSNTFQYENHNLSKLKVSDCRTTSDHHASDLLSAWRHLC